MLVPSARKFDEMFSDPPLSSQRRTSGRQGDDRRRMHEAEEERQRRERDLKKARESAAREEKERKRTKDRRRDMEAKSSRKFSTHMDTDGSDSEMDIRRHNGKREATPPKRRYEDVRRKPEWDEPRRSSKREDLRRSRNKDVDEDSIEANVAAAQEYMSRSRETFREVEVEPRTRPSRKRADSNLERATPIAPPKPSRPVDNRRRSSEREKSDKERSGRSGGESDRRDDRRRAGRGSRQPSPVRRDSGKKDKKYREPEIVEPVASGRKASLPIFGSDGKGFKEKMFGSVARKEPHRSMTSHQAPAEFKHPGMRRAETMPINNMRRNEPVPLKSSHLKNTKAPSDDDTSSSDDSDSSEATNDTPEIKPRNTTHKYKVNTDSEAQSPRTVYMEPDDMYDTPKARHSAERPRMPGRGSSSRAPPPPSRSAAFAEDRPPRPSGLSRAESSRGGSSSGAPPPPLTKSHGSGRGKHLFGAVEDDDEVARFMQSSSASSPKIISSPKMSPADVRYSSTRPPRRASEDVDRDAFPGSLHRSHRRPSYQRGETAF